MPLSKYFGGHGAEVMADMQQKHGEEEGERIFYATANKRKKEAARKGKGKAVKELANRRK